MPDAAPPLHVALSDAAAAAPEPGRISSLHLRHGTLELRFYAPRGHDPQTPHERDELYIVASGKGIFVCGNRRVRFAPGDALFVAAGEPHRFEDFSADFGVWVMFYGPPGGEAA